MTQQYLHLEFLPMLDITSVDYERDKTDRIKRIVDMVNQVSENGTQRVYAEWARPILNQLTGIIHEESRISIIIFNPKNGWNPEISFISDATFDGFTVTAMPDKSDARLPWHVRISWIKGFYNEEWKQAMIEGKGDTR